MTSATRSARTQYVSRVPRVTNGPNARDGMVEKINKNTRDCRSCGIIRFTEFVGRDHIVERPSSSDHRPDTDRRTEKASNVLPLCIRRRRRRWDERENAVRASGDPATTAARVLFSCRSRARVKSSQTPGHVVVARYSLSRVRGFNPVSRPFPAAYYRRHYYRRRRRRRIAP